MAKKIAIITDSNSGITQTQAKEWGLYVLPMPFMINNEIFYEDITLTQEEFYIRLADGADVITSQPTPDSVLKLWDSLLEDYDEIVHIPMSSGLSGSCQSATMLAQDYDGRVQVVNNQRISVTQRQSALDALELVKRGMDDALQIKEFLEKDKFNSSIYIMLDTLYYLKKGGRITPAAAALGTILKLKPVLQIQGDKLDAFAKARTVSQGKSIMINAIRSDMEKRFGGATADNIWLEIAYSYDLEAATQLKEEVQEQFPGFDVHIDPLSLSVACHIGPGALAVACCKKI